MHQSLRESLNLSWISQRQRSVIRGACTCFRRSRQAVPVCAFLLRQSTSPSRFHLCHICVLQWPYHLAMYNFVFNIISVPLCFTSCYQRLLFYIILPYSNWPRKCCKTDNSHSVKGIVSGDRVRQSQWVDGWCKCISLGYCSHAGHLVLLHISVIVPLHCSTAAKCLSRLGHGIMNCTYSCRATLGY